MADEMNTERDMPEGITRDDTVHGQTYYTASDYAKARNQGFRDGVASLGAAEPAIPALQPDVQNVDRGFRWDCEKQHHVPTLLLEFEPVPANSPCDAKGWKDRNALADLLAKAPTLTQGAAIAAGAVYAELPEFDSGDEPIWDAIFKWKGATPGADALGKANAVESAIIDQLRAFADRTHAIRASHGQAPAGATTEPAGRVYSANCEYAVVQWLRQTSEVGGGDPKNSWSWPTTGDAVFLAQPTAQAAPAADYDHGPQSTTVEEAARNVGKWLNERPNRPLDLRDVAMLAAHAQAPAAGAVAVPAATVIKRGADREFMSERLGHLPDGIYSLYLAAPTPAAQADSGPAPMHGDEVAVNTLAGLMKAKLAKQRAKGYGGWDSTECTQQHLSNLLRAHVDKGDPVDVANFCAFLSARSEGIAPQAGSGVQEDAARLTSEQERALRDAYETAGSESYFEPRPQIDTIDRRRVFAAGFERGWDAARATGAKP